MSAGRAEFLYSTEEGPLRVGLHYLLPSGEYRRVLVERGHDTPARRMAIGDALGAASVVSKGEAVRRGWRSRVGGGDGGAT